MEQPCLSDVLLLSYDIYIEKDICEGKLTEEEAQELIDQFIIKLRIVRFLRTPEYNDLFSGDPVWVTESLGGQVLTAVRW